MSDTTRQAGFGLSKQNTAGPTAGHSDFPRFHGTKVPGQRQTGPAWRQQCIHDITVAPGPGACEAGRRCPCCRPLTSLGPLPSTASRIRESRTGAAGGGVGWKVPAAPPLLSASSSSQHWAPSIHSFSFHKLSTYSEPSLVLGTKAACTKEQDIVPTLQELLVRQTDEQIITDHPEAECGVLGQGSTEPPLSLHSEQHRGWCPWFWVQGEGSMVDGPFLG